MKSKIKEILFAYFSREDYNKKEYSKVFNLASEEITQAIFEEKQKLRLFESCKSALRQETERRERAEKLLLEIKQNHKQMTQKLELKPFFMIYVEGGNAPTMKHDNITSARLEAERLAIKSNSYVTILIAYERHMIAPKTIVTEFEQPLPF